jgi:DNA-binding FrmR family transcriptional regulator
MSNSGIDQIVVGEEVTVAEQVSKEVLVKRLRRIEGQTSGLQKMITDDRDSESIMTQLMAVRGAL